MQLYDIFKFANPRHSNEISLHPNVPVYVTSLSITYTYVHVVLCSAAYRSVSVSLPLFLGYVVCPCSGWLAGWLAWHSLTVPCTLASMQTSTNRESTFNIFPCPRRSLPNEHGILDDVYGAARRTGSGVQRRRRRSQGTRQPPDTSYVLN